MELQIRPLTYARTVQGDVHYGCGEYNTADGFIVIVHRVGQYRSGQRYDHWETIAAWNRDEPTGLSLAIKRSGLGDSTFPSQREALEAIEHFYRTWEEQS